MANKCYRYESVGIMFLVYLGYHKESDEKKYEVIEDSECDESADTRNVSQGEIKMECKHRLSKLLYIGFFIYFS